VKESSESQPVLSDQSICWQSFQQGNDAALATIYSIYFDHLYNYGLKFTHDISLVEDCIQELFIKLMRNRQNLALPASVKNYLFKALRSQIYDELEKLKKRPLKELQESAGFELELHRVSDSVDDEDERHQKLQAALAQLTPRQREVIFLKYQEGFSYPEIAEILSLTQKATYKLVGRAIQTLRSNIFSNPWGKIVGMAVLLLYNPFLTYP
jgi:RNA polymerase sigma factor (sigma-70 family)